MISIGLFILFFVQYKSPVAIEKMQNHLLSIIAKQNKRLMANERSLWPSN